MTPWKPAQPGLEAGVSSATNFFNNLPAAYSGRFTAGTSPYQYQALDALRGTANAAGPNYGQGALSLGDYFTNKLNSGGYKPPTFGSYDTSAIQPVIESLTRPIFQKYQENVIPQIKSQATANGAYQAPYRSAEDIAQRNFLGELTNTATQVGYQDFSDFRNLLTNANSQELQAAGSIPGLYNNALGAASGYAGLLGQLGAGYESLGQRDIDEALKRNQYDRTYGFQDVGNLMNLLLPAGQAFNTSTVTQQLDPWTQAIQLGTNLIGAFTGAKLPDLKPGAPGASVVQPQNMMANPYVSGPPQQDPWYYSIFGGR